MLFSAADSNFSDEDSKFSDDAFDFDTIIDFACRYEAFNPFGALLVGKNGKQYIYPWTWKKAEQKLLHTSLEVVYYHEDKEFTRIAMQKRWIALCTQTFENAVDVQFWENQKERDRIRILNIRSPITHFIGLEKGVFCLATEEQLVMVNCHGVRISGDIINRPKNIRYYDSKLKIVDCENIITYGIDLKELSHENHSEINLWESLWCGITSAVFAIRSQPNLDTWKNEFANRVKAKLTTTRERAVILDPCGEALVTFEKDLHDGKLDLQSKGKLLGSMPADYRWRLHYLSASRQIIVEDTSDLCVNYLDCYELASEESEDEWKGIWRVDIGHRNGLRIHESGNQLFLLTDHSFSILKTSGIDKVEEKVLFRYKKL